MDSETRRFNASRPSVIYFHGIPVEVIKKYKNTLPNELECERNDCSGVKRKTDEVQYVKETNESRTADAECDETDEECLRKRHRTSFTTFQLKRLEEVFEQDCYIVGMKRWRLSEELEIPEKQIKIWFQNKRTKLKRDYTHCTHK